MMQQTKTSIGWIAKLSGAWGGVSSRRKSNHRNATTVVSALEQRMLLDGPLPVTANATIASGITGLDGLPVLLTGRDLSWGFATSGDIGSLLDAPASWWTTSSTMPISMATSFLIPVASAAPRIEFNQVKGTSGLAGVWVTTTNLFGGGYPPGVWSQGGDGSGGFYVNAVKDVVSSKVSLTTSNGCNTVIDDETWVGGSDAGEIKVNLQNFAAGTYSLTFDVVTIFSVSGGGAGGTVSMTGVPGHQVTNPGTAPITSRFNDTVTCTVSVGASGNALAFRWTPTIGMNLATVENTTIEGHIAMTSISKQ